MAPGLSDSLSVATALAGTTSALATLVSHRLFSKRAGQEAKVLSDEKLQRVLDLSDLAGLSEYLWRDIGRIRMSDLSADDRLRSRSNAVLDRILNYVGSTDDVALIDSSTDTETIGEPSMTIPKRTPSGSLDEELTRALQDIEVGEVWNGLARLRRHIEVVIGGAFEAPERGGPVALGQMLRMAERHEVLSSDGVRLLRFAVSIANRAVHGEAVTREEAREAFDAAVRGLSSITF